MKATVLGIRKVNYKKDGKAKEGKEFFLSFESEGVEGVETASIWHDETKYGQAPALGIGEVTDISYNRFGSLRFGV